MTIVSTHSLTDPISKSLFITKRCSKTVFVPLTSLLLLSIAANNPSTKNQLRNSGTNGLGHRRPPSCPHQQQPLPPVQLPWPPSWPSNDILGLTKNLASTQCSSNEPLGFAQNVFIMSFILLWTFLMCAFTFVVVVVVVMMIATGKSTFTLSTVPYIIKEDFKRKKSLVPMGTLLLSSFVSFSTLPLVSASLCVTVVDPRKLIPL